MLIDADECTEVTVQSWCTTQFLLLGVLSCRSCDLSCELRVAE